MEVKKEQIATHFLYPSALHTPKKPCIVTTILGSCVAVCLFDPILKVGGINHYMLPLWNGEGLPSPKYGNIAINKLIKKMADQGSMRHNMIAKIFGGAEKSEPTSNHFFIGRRNIQIAEEILKEENIKIVGQSTGGYKGRKLQFHTHTGEVYMKYVMREL